MKRLYILFASLPLLVAAGTASATLITNGDFSSGGAGWDASTSPGVTFEDGVAKLGRPGAGGVSSLEQEFDPSGGTEFSVAFDYTWEGANSAENDDNLLTVQFVYNSGGSQVVDQIFVQNAPDSLPSADASFLDTIMLSASVDSDLTIRFLLDETLSSPGNGSYVVLDNIAVTAVPLPAAAWLFISAVSGLLVIGRRRRRFSATAIVS